MYGCNSITGKWVLSSCPNLHILVATLDALNAASVPIQCEASATIDQDPDTGSLKAWSCEASLRVLRVKIIGIPRPDLIGYRSTKESCPDQGREIQGQVYDRLARLTNLETLWLGHGPYIVCKRYVDGKEECDGLEMSLESELHRLARLKFLRDLNVFCIKSRIGLKEAQWMIEYWPRLRIIYGLEMDATRQGYGYGNIVLGLNSATWICVSDIGIPCRHLFVQSLDACKDTLDPLHHTGSAEGC